MKTILPKKTYLVALITLIPLFACAQDNVVSPNAIKINGIVSLSETESNVRGILGNPNSTVTEYSELEDQNIRVLRYGTSKLRFMNGKLDTFSLRSSNLNLKYLGTTFKVGDNISILSGILSSSYSNRSGGEMTFDLANADFYISIFYDSNNLITEIELRTY